MKKDTKLKKGDLVQLSPDDVKNKGFSGCIMMVTEPKAFGCQGFVQALGTRDKMGGAAYYRAGWEEMELVGEAIWMPKEEENGD